jgi:hypothetical protein
LKGYLAPAAERAAQQVAVSDTTKGAVAVAHVRALTAASPACLLHLALTNLAFYFVQAVSTVTVTVSSSLVAGATAAAQVRVPSICVAALASCSSPSELMCLQAAGLGIIAVGGIFGDGVRAGAG